MVIPASLDSKTDMSTDSIRIGLSLTAPLIVTLMVAPNSILSLIGPESHFCRECTSGFICCNISIYDSNKRHLEV